MASLICGIEKKNDTNELTKQKDTHRLRELNLLLPGEGWGKKTGCLGWTCRHCYILNG